MTSFILFGLYLVNHCSDQPLEIKASLIYSPWGLREKIRGLVRKKWGAELWGSGHTRPPILPEIVERIMKNYDPGNKQLAVKALICMVFMACDIRV